ncbi:receptor-like protein EIX2 [Cannabis sativa]|uniref:receptor-like protein EIX2 n=1 Tax=Cannabis sativa TaxID=3483 RepID=UPI0029C9D773|nr:receptor-like protein EIX2 [Cannabis sativa]
MMMSRSRVPQMVVLFLLLIIISIVVNSGAVGEPKIRCNEAERLALLTIKDHLYDHEDGDVLSSWGEEEERRECCEWIGIKCNNNSNNHHVTKLDLSPSTFDSFRLLGGNISSSLLDLKYLNHLDLSSIHFGENSIPTFIGSLSKLRYLNLSSTGLSGEIPPQLGNLSSLEVLDLSGSFHSLKVKTLNWVLNLSSLRVLDLSNTNMSLANDWVHVVNNLPHLTNLILSFCYLPNVALPQSSAISHFNSSKDLRVIDFSANSLMSESIFPWLFNYSRSLVHLDLSFCESRGVIPNGFENMASLTYLDLTSNDLVGIIPESFGNLISLTYLSLQFNHLDGFHPKSFKNMTALTHLDLSYNDNLKGSIPEGFGNMVSLTHLDLSWNQIETLNPKSFENMTSLNYLDLNRNRLKGSIPENFGNMASLEYLDLSNNTLEGEIPKSIWKICKLREMKAFDNRLSGELHFADSPSKECAKYSLEYLNLKQNHIMGPLPDFTFYPSLIDLYLSSNKFSKLSKSMGHLSKLKILDLSENSIKDVLSETHFSNLFNLSSLDLSTNIDLAMNISFDWIPPFQLFYVHLGSCKLGPHFPKWIQTQNKYFELNVSNSGILGSVPDWLWDFNPYLSLLDLSNNKINGSFHDFEQGINISWDDRSHFPDIDLSSNQFEGSIPRFLLQIATSLNLFNNNFSQLNSLCNITDSNHLIFLDVSYNKLSGELPDCWSQAHSLRILVLANNELSGKIPNSIGFINTINILHLGKNNLNSELPSSMKNCTELVIFDVGENKLMGPIPAWIGTSLTKLRILSARSNNFNGSIPLQLCHLEDLQLLDLSSNDLSNQVPNYLGNITAMKETGDQNVAIKYPYSATRGRAGVPFDFNRENLVLVWKGAISEFKNVGLLKSIDLSSNKLIGEIPKDITKLGGLISLNLSRNNLSGHIPQEIGDLKSLDVLDLSKNYFSGQIPLSLSQVDRLSTLDFSSNNLSGEIPKSTQLQSRDAVAYMGNPQLCGIPLLTKCPNEEETTTYDEAMENHDGDEFISKGFYISLALGIVVGFWGFCGTLIFNKTWRYAYFKQLNNVGEYLAHISAVALKKKLFETFKS